MKKFLYMAVAAIAALSSCSQDDLVSDENGNDVSNANAPVFTATIEGEGKTRTQLVEGSTGKLTKVAWASEDKVNINGSAYTAAPGTEDATTATLTIADGQTAPEAVDGKYYAVYPSTIAFNTSTQTITLPATQTYDATTNGIGNVPMVAVSENTTLQFKNICAVLAIKVASGTVKAIKVMADQKNLSGDFTLDPSTSAITATTTGSNTVSLECGTAVTANNTTFYIAIPPQEYSSLQIYLSADGTTYKEAMATKVAAGLGTIARNKIINIDYAKNAVQLWADGPYFATVNVGETTETGNSTGYKWGATQAGDAGTGNKGNYDLDHDTAYKIWGSAWRMPTNDEFTGLNNNCTNTYGAPSGTYGFTVQGSEGYGSIFLPVVPSVQTTDYQGFAFYWSATPKGEDYANLLFLYKAPFVLNIEESQYSREIPYFVRAVLATPAAAPASTPTPTSNLLPGEFSVGADKKVQFTKGNLWCNTTTSPVTYAFETNQYDYPVATDYTSDGTKDGTWYGTHVGHFFWTTAAADSYAQHYYNNSFTNTTSDKFWLDGSDADHKLTVSGTSDLYVLSKAEWEYLIETRANASSLYKKSVTVAGKAGCLIIAPDNYTGSIADSYDAAAWATAEAAGLVCLPIAGHRDNDNPFDAGAAGNYWASTPDASADQAMRLCFNAEDVYTFLNNPRQYGFPLRLVKMVGAAPAPTSTPETATIANNSQNNRDKLSPGKL